MDHLVLVLPLCLFLIVLFPYYSSYISLSHTLFTTLVRSDQSLSPGTYPHHPSLFRFFHIKFIRSYHTTTFDFK